MAIVRGPGAKGLEAPAPIVNISERRSRRESIHPGRKVGVFLAVPSESGQVNYSIPMTFARSMASNFLAECPFHFTVHMEVGKRPVDFARNSIVKTFLEESDADWLVMVDDDQGIPENWWQLCTVRDADVVAGLTPVWVGNGDPEAMLRVNNYGVDSSNRCFNLQAPDQKVQQPYRVPVVGTGCIAIRRRVLAPRPAGVGSNPFYFTHQEDRKIMGGEDINFSVECNRLGFVLAVHPQVWFDHVKPLPLRQIEQYYQARKAMEMSGRRTTDEQRISIG